MWKDYFGPKCRIYGVDLERACKVYEDDRTKILIGDQGDHDFWRRLKDEVPHIDILIDDGGHSPEQQLTTLEAMLPHLSPGGVYLCEDVVGDQNRFTSYVHGLVTSLNAFTLESVSEKGEESGPPTPFQAAIQSIHFYPFVTVIEKNDGPVELTARKRGTEWQPFL